MHLTLFYDFFNLIYRHFCILTGSKSKCGYEYQVQLLGWPLKGFYVVTFQ